MGCVCSGARSGLNATAGSAPAGVWLGRSWSVLCCLLNVPQPTDAAEITCRGKKIKSDGRRAVPSGETCGKNWMQASVMLTV